MRKLLVAWLFAQTASAQTPQPFNCAPDDWFVGWSKDLDIEVTTINFRVDTASKCAGLVGGKIKKPESAYCDGVKGESTVGFLSYIKCESFLPLWFNTFESLIYQGQTYAVQDIDAFMQFPNSNGKIYLGVIPKVSGPRDITPFIFLEDVNNDGTFTVYKRFVLDNTWSCGAQKNQIFRNRGSPTENTAGIAIKHCDTTKMGLWIFSFAPLTATQFLPTNVYQYQGVGTFKSLSVLEEAALRNSGMMLGTYTSATGASLTKMVIFDDERSNTCTFSIANTFSISAQTVIFSPINSFVTGGPHPTFLAFFEMASPGPDYIILSTHGPQTCDSQDLLVNSYHDPSGNSQLKIVASIYDIYNNLNNFVTIALKDLTTGNFMIVGHNKNLSVNQNIRFSISEPNLANYLSLTSSTSSQIYSLQINKQTDQFSLAIANYNTYFSFFLRVQPGDACVQQVEGTPVAWTEASQANHECTDIGEFLAETSLGVNSTSASKFHVTSVIPACVQEDEIEANNLHFNNPCGVFIDTTIADQIYERSSGNKIVTGTPTSFADTCLDYDPSQVTYQFDEMKVGTKTVTDCVYDDPSNNLEDFIVNTNDFAYIGTYPVKYTPGYLGSSLKQVQKTFLLTIKEPSCSVDLTNCCVNYPVGQSYFTYELTGSLVDWAADLGMAINGDCNFQMFLQPGSSYQATGASALPSAFQLVDVVTFSADGMYYDNPPPGLPSITTLSSDLTLAGFYTLAYTAISLAPQDNSRSTQKIVFYLRNPTDCLQTWSLPADGAKDLTIQVGDTVDISLQDFDNNGCKFTPSISQTENGLFSLIQPTWCATNTPTSKNSYDRSVCSTPNQGKITVAPTLNSQAGVHTITLTLQSNRYKNDPAFQTYQIQVTVLPCEEELDIPTLVPNEFYFMVGDTLNLEISLREFEAMKTCRGFDYEVICQENSFVKYFSLDHVKDQGTMTSFFTTDVSLVSTDIHCSIRGKSVVDNSLFGQVDFILHFKNPCYDTSLTYPTAMMPSITIQAGDPTKDIIWDDFLYNSSIACDIQYFVSFTVLTGFFDKKWQNMTVSENLVQLTVPATAIPSVLTYTIEARVNGDSQFPFKVMSFQVTIKNLNVFLPNSTDQVPQNTTEANRTEEAEKFDISVFFDSLYEKWIKPNSTTNSEPLEAYVYSIDNRGNLIVNFTKPLLIPLVYQNLTLEKEARVYNETIQFVIALSVESEVEFDPDLNAQNILMFNLTNFTTWGLEIHITFEHPDYITTSRLTPDQLKIDFIQADLFVDKRDYQRLADNTTLFSELPPQMSEEAALLSEAIQANAKSTGNVIGYITIVFQLGLSFALKYVWNMFNLLQFFAFIEKWKGLQIPQTPALDFIVFIRQICLQEFIPYAWFTEKAEKLFGLSEDDILTIDASFGNSTNTNSTQIDNNANNTDFNQTRRRLQTAVQPKKKSSFLKDMGVMLLVGVFLVSIVLLLFMVRLCVNYNYRLYRFYMGIQSRLFFNPFIRYILQSVLKMEFAAVVQLQASSQLAEPTSSPLYWVSIILMLTFMICPILFFYVMFKNQDILQKPSMKAKIGSLYLGTQTTDIYCLMYSSVFLLRRLLFVVLAWQLGQYPALQVQIFIGSNVLYAVYLHKAMPHEDRLSSATETSNEALFMLLFYHFLPFCGLTDDPEVLRAVGKSLVAVVGIMFVFNICVILFVTYKGVARQFYLKKLRKFKIKQREERLKKLIAVLQKKAQESRDRQEQAKIAKKLAKLNKLKPKQIKVEKKVLTKVKTGIPKSKPLKIVSQKEEGDKFPDESQKSSYFSRKFDESHQDESLQMFGQPMTLDHVIAKFHGKNQPSQPIQRYPLSPSRPSWRLRDIPQAEPVQEELEISDYSDYDNTTYLEKPIDDSSYNWEDSQLMFARPMTLDAVIAKFHRQPNAQTLTIRPGPIASLDSRDSEIPARTNKKFKENPSEKSPRKDNSVSKQSQNQSKPQAVKKKDKNVPKKKTGNK